MPIIVNNVVAIDDLLAEGNAALRRGDGPAARAAFEQALADGGPDGLVHGGQPARSVVA